MKDDFVDYYACLGIDKSATEQELKQAYRHLAKSCHPDRHQGSAHAEEQFKKLNEAYAVLSKSSSRADYDLSYTRRETARAARLHEEFVKMHRQMQVHARKSNDAMARRERRAMRDPNRPVRRRPLLLRRETPPPFWLACMFFAFWIWVILTAVVTFFM